MANVEKGSAPLIDVKTDTLQELASQAKTAADALQEAAKQIKAARRHEGWRCNERWNVSNQINKESVGAERVARYLNQLSTILQQSASELESTQGTIISSLSDPKLKKG